MSKEKQIEEMVRELEEAHHKMDVAWTNHFIDKVKFPKPKPEHTLLAEHLYNAGYRKQEWISVEDRLPEDQQTVLTIDTEGEMRVCFYETEWEGIFQMHHGLTKIFNITHWMPLPQAPKMKGGAK